MGFIKVTAEKGQFDLDLCRNGGDQPLRSGVHISSSSPNGPGELPDRNRYRVNINHKQPYTRLLRSFAKNIPVLWPSFLFFFYCRCMHVYVHTRYGKSPLNVLKI